MGTEAMTGQAAQEDTDVVRLAMPADPEYLRLARIAATGLTSRMGFTFDEIEDLRIAIDELCSALIGTHGRLGRLELRYRGVPGGIEVRGRLLDGDASVVLRGLSELSELILSAVTEEYELALDGEPAFRFVKRHGETGDVVDLGGRG